MVQYRSNSHSVSNLSCHIVWAVGFGVLSTGQIADEMVQEYLEYHKDKSNSEKGNWTMQ